MRRITQSLAALPAYQGIPALADAPPAFTEVGIRYSHYSEDSLDRDKMIFGSENRYDIDITQLWIEAPMGANWSVALDVQNDYQSGASPWFVGAQGNGDPGVIMSGASIQDNRVEVGVATRYFWADGNAGFAISHSDEDDYDATALGFDIAWNSAVAPGVHLLAALRITFAQPKGLYPYLSRKVNSTHNPRISV